MLFNTYQVRNKIEKSDNTKFCQRHVEPSYVAGGCYKLFNHFVKTTCHNLLVLEMCSLYDPTDLLPGETLEYMYYET